MRYRQFGRLGWQVSDIGYGMWGMGGWSGSEDSASLTALDRAVALGCNFYDTAYAYGDGRSEKLLGETLKRHADTRLYIATKVPPKNRVWPGRASTPISQVFPYDYIVEMTEKSLKNLGSERLDLQQLHVWSDAWVEDDGWRRAAEDLKRDGKIEGFGISVNRWEPANVLKALDTGLVDAVQVVYNIFDQAPEDELFPACQRLNVAVIARVPFDEGSLTGTLTPDTKWPEGDFAQLLLHAGQSEDDSGARRSPEAAGPRRHHAPRPRPPLHRPSPRGVDDDPGHASGEERRGQHRLERRPTARARFDDSPPRPPLGPQSGPPVGAATTTVRRG